MNSQVENQVSNSYWKGLGGTKWHYYYYHIQLVLQLGGTFMAKLVSFPDQIFHVCPADSSKNRVWTLSLRKLGQVGGQEIG